MSPEDKVLIRWDALGLQPQLRLDDLKRGNMVKFNKGWDWAFRSQARGKRFIRAMRKRALGYARAGVRTGAVVLAVCDLVDAMDAVGPRKDASR